MIVLLLPHPAGGGASLGPESLDTLADLGITSISLVRDEQSTGFVLEGWAFDPDRSTHAAVSALAGSTEGARTLHALTRMTVAPGYVNRRKEPDEG